MTDRTVADLLAHWSAVAPRRTACTDGVARVDFAALQARVLRGAGGLWALGLEYELNRMDFHPLRLGVVQSP